MPEYFYVMTLELPGRSAGQWHGTFVPGPGFTRRDTFNALKAQLEAENPEMRGSVVSFFQLEPNQL
ncbi:hypothetical protein B591_13273 [Streptomyces sp. GBA 94-10 4N24]|uniref:hypothetical protein n=1 Tax=Streptomyces sp. GBA 94-10 4N24 TaxID=1218177 RepID=UPI0003C32878|nr:hypothetical protein [Streptomyces sp. GBA 94-10 4N24]ESP99129.1 hypothetical protein B591_13273 [Streptomyces sp. GBA 94-10 4N24]UZN59637.1 hypothetical protein B591N_13273 [Streptomyces sp. GBA 94-10 4N24]